MQKTNNQSIRRKVGNMLVLSNLAREVENDAFAHATCQINELNPLKPAKGTDVHRHLNHR